MNALSMWRRAWFVLLPGFVSLSDLRSEESVMVKTSTEVEKAWMGQRVRFVVTLYSPGPFTGTPVFQLPEIADTVISKVGSPVVGSVTLSGTTWITQRHEFDLYTQKVGELQVPAFKVSFESKDDFTGDAKPREGETEPFGVVSERPPGTESLPFVVTSSSLKVEETWSAEEGAELEAGEVVTRSITRSATDTSAMFLDPFVATPVEGARVYLSDPVIDEVSQRGVTEVSRTDVIRYQFAKGGQFDFPSIDYSWWDPESEEVRTEVLAGRSFSAKAPPVPPEPTDWKRVAWIALAGLTALAAIVRWGWPFGVAQFHRWRAWYDAPIRRAVRHLKGACGNGDAKEAYAALMAWKHAAGVIGDFDPPLREPAAALSRRLFGSGGDGGAWDGGALWSAFRAVEDGHRGGRHSRTKASLPPLNPGLSR